MKMSKVLIWLVGQASLPVLTVIMLSTANAAWISYTSNQGVSVVQESVVPQPVARQPQIIPSHNSPQSLDSSQVKLVKLVDTPTIFPGGTITYTIIATNQGTEPITDITFIDALPPYTTFLDASGLGTITYCHNNSGTDFDYDNSQPVSHVRWSISDISPSGTATFVLKVKVK